jgi:hypothetical protein
MLPGVGCLVAGYVFRYPIPNLTARFAQDAKDAKKIFLSNRVTASLEELTGSLRFDKTFDPAGSYIHSKCEDNLCDLCALAVQYLASGLHLLWLCGSASPSNHPHPVSHTR